MTLVNPPFGDRPLLAWRLDRANYASTWSSGEGAYLAGGRWNNPGRRAVYCAFDPATAILEVAVHKGFDALDTIPHVLTCLEVADPSEVHILDASSIPNPNWLMASVHGAGQRSFGDQLLGKHKFIAVPSAVSRHSWNLVFFADHAAGAYALKLQEPFALDTRLNPPRPPSGAQK